MKIKVFTAKGEMKQEVNLPKEYDVVTSSALLKQAQRVLEDGTHPGLSKVKTRSEVNLTKKKLYKQKGTGGARHGAKSAHIFVGGGVAHGPTGEKRFLTLPLKMKKAALALSLKNKFKSGKAVLVEGFDKLSKTKEASKLVNLVLKKLEVSAKVTVVLSASSISNTKVFRNIKNLKVKNFSSLNALDVITSGILLVDSSLFINQKEEKKVKKTVKKAVK